MPRTVIATRYVTPLREGGSVPGLVEADDDGLYVLKFHAAAQGPRALVAELVAGEIGRELGLPVPEIVLVGLDPALGQSEPDEEIRPVILASGGLNLGMDFLPGSLPFNPAVGPLPSPDLAADIVWFDALVTNPDRTAQNPNMIVWHGRPWLIDHGAALYVHYTWRDPAEHARRSFDRIRSHVLLSRAGSIEAADERLAGRLSEPFLVDLIATIPDAWLADDPTIGGPKEQRRAYLQYLLDRLAGPRPFVREAESARAA